MEKNKASCRCMVYELCLNWPIRIKERLMKAALLVLALILSGCSTLTTTRYSMLADNNRVLKGYAGNKIQVTAMGASTNYEVGCRLVGDIKTPDKTSIPAFIGKAFNDEFEFAGLYSNNGRELSGQLTRIAFSSSSGALSDGWWEFGLLLQSSNGKAVDVVSRYDFASSIIGESACQLTAQAFTPAVQDLIKKTVTDPKFGELLQ
jgi:hypothetical protein